jgi:hypothetical protein
VKASQCFTKYKWRDDAAAAREGGPQIVATQVPVLAILQVPLSPFKRLFLVVLSVSLKEHACCIDGV